MGNTLVQLLSDGKIYLVAYFVLFVFIILENCNETLKYRYWSGYVVSIFLILFTGLRWETGTDWTPYKELFDSIKFDWTFLLNVYSFDLGYVLFNALGRILTDNYTVFLLIDSALAIGMITWFFRKHSPNPLLSFFIFYNAFFIAQFMGSNRRIISLACSLFFFYAVFHKKKRLQFFSFLSAFFFHRSSLVLLLTYFIPKKRFTITRSLIYIGTSLILGIAQFPFKAIGIIGSALSVLTSNPIVEKMLFYSDNSDEQIPENVDPKLQMILSVIKRSIFLSFYFWVIKRRKGVLDPLTDFFFNIYIIGFVIYILLNGSPIFQMLSTYFTFIEIVLIGRIWFFSGKHERLIFFAVLFFYGFFQLLNSVNAYPELFIPYKSFLTSF